MKVHDNSYYLPRGRARRKGNSYCPLKIQRALHLFSVFRREAVQIDHRRPDVRVAQQRLDRAEIVPRLKHVGGVTVPESVGRDALCEFGLSDRFAENLLHPRVMQMIAPRFFRLREERQRLLRQKPLPDKLLRGPRILLLKLIVKKDPGVTRREIFVMQFFHALQLGLKFREDRPRQRHGPHFIALPPDRKHAAIEIEIFYPKRAALRNAQPAPVLELGHELEGMPEMGQDRIYFLPAKDRGDIV